MDTWGTSGAAVLDVPPAWGPLRHCPGWTASKHSHATGAAAAGSCSDTATACCSCLSPLQVKKEQAKLAEEQAELLARTRDLDERDRALTRRAIDIESREEKMSDLEVRLQKGQVSRSGLLWDWARAG